MMASLWDMASRALGLNLKPQAEPKPKPKAAGQEPRKDSFVNLLTGLGNPYRDKRLSTYYEPDIILDVTTLDNLYHGNDLAARICNLYPDEAFRKGYAIRAGGDDPGEFTEQISGLMAKAVELNVDQKSHNADVWSRVFGAGILFVGADDGQDPKEPLNEEKIKSVRFLTLVERKDLTPSKWYSDPLSAKYGQVETYRINYINMGSILTPEFYGAEIHESRLVIYPGTLTSRAMMQRNEWWPLSVLQRCSRVLFDFNTSWEFMSVLLQDVSQGIFKLDGLIEMIAEGEEQRLQERMMLTDMARSVGNSIMLDAEREDFRRETVNVTGIPDLLKEFQKRLAASVPAPLTILFGVTPSGLGATADQDIRWFYDHTESHRQNIIKPRLHRIYRLFMLAKDGPTGGVELPNWCIEFDSLWQMSEKEEAELRRLQADTDVAYINSGVLLPEEVTLSRFRAEGYSLETIADLELRTSELEKPPAPDAQQEIEAQQQGDPNETQA